MREDDKIHCPGLSLLCQVRTLQCMLIFLRKSWRKENSDFATTPLQPCSMTTVTEIPIVSWVSSALISMTNITFIHTNLKQYLYAHPEELWLHHLGSIVITHRYLKKGKLWFEQIWVHKLTLQVTNCIAKYINLFLWNKHLVCGWLAFSKLQLFQLSLQWKY